MCSKRIVLSTDALIICACYCTFLKILLGSLTMCVRDTIRLDSTGNIRLIDLAEYFDKFSWLLGF